MRGSPSLLVCLALLAVPSIAWAGDEAAAEALFGQAKKLAAQGKYSEACPKFAESNRLDRGAGTLIHLGDCYEKNKQTASAWATYKDAASAAQALGRKDWEKLATQRATALEAKLAHLTIKVDPANEKDGTNKTDVSRDGSTVSAVSWGVPLPVDSGMHTVEATGAGKKSFKTTVKVTKDGENVEVTVPKLEPDGTAAAPVAPKVDPTPPPKPATPPPPKKEGGSGQKTIGMVLGGVGVAGIAVGAITGLMAIGKNNDAKDACPNDGPCGNRAAVDAADSASTLGLVSTIGFIAGGALLATGGVLFLTAPSAAGDPPKQGKARVRFSPTAGGFTVFGAF